MSSSDNDRNRDYESGTANVVKMHNAVRREKPLQQSGSESLSAFPLILCALVLVAGGGFLFKNANGFSTSTFINNDYQPDPRPEIGDGPTGPQLTWIEDWMKGGKKVYGNCAACHGGNGSGAAGNPPLANSEWVNGGTSRLGAILLHGINGPFTVAGKKYNGAMPAWKTMSDKQIAQVLTYIRREFGTMPDGEDGIVTKEMIAAAREKYSSQSGAYNEAQLLAIPETENLPGAKVDPLTGEAL